MSRNAAQVLRVGSALVALTAVFVAAARGTGAEADASPPLFAVELESCSYGGAAVGDLDADGRPEVVFGTYYNDERLVALRGDGTLLWSVPSGGGPIDNSVTVADLDLDGRPEVVWGNSETTVLHVADASGHDLWSHRIGEVLDAPKAVADLDGDGRLELIVASCGAPGAPGGLRAFDAATGQPIWTAAVGGCYQSAPLLFDADGDALPDIVVSTWFDNKVRSFSGRDGSLRWEAEIGDDTYHAGSFGDMNGDDVPDVAVGDFSASLWAIDGIDGTILWRRALAGERYIFGPTAMGDVDADGEAEIVVTGDRLHVYDADGSVERSIELAGYCTRGPVLADIDDDGAPDMLVGLNGPRLSAYSGIDGRLLYDRRLEPAGDFDFQPVVADLDGNGENDAFFVYGRGHSDTPLENWGRAVAVRLGGRGPWWPTFSHDHHHSGNYASPAGEAVNRPGPTTSATAPPPSPSPTAAIGSATPQRTATSTAAHPAPTAAFLPRALRQSGAVR